MARQDIYIYIELYRDFRPCGVDNSTRQWRVWMSRVGCMHMNFDLIGDMVAH